jgi:hypothetical protein
MGGTKYHSRPHDLDVFILAPDTAAGQFCLILANLEVLDSKSRSSRVVPFVHELR